MSGSNISGTPTTPGTSSVTVTVTDSVGNTASQVFSLVVSAAETNPVVGSLATQTLTTGVAYSLTLTASGGTSPYTFTTTALPAGLALSGAVISGTPTTAGTTSVTITVKDSLGNTGTEVVSFVVQATVPTLVFAAVPTPQDLTVGTAYSLSLASYASGGTTPYSFTSTALPAGLTLTAETISGTPTTAGTTSVTITLTDSTLPTHQTATRVVSMVVAAAVVAGSAPAMPGVTSGATRVFANGVSSGTPLNAGQNFPTATTVPNTTGTLSNFSSVYPQLATAAYSGWDEPADGANCYYSTNNVLYCAAPSGGGSGYSMYYNMYVGNGAYGNGLAYTAAPVPTMPNGNFAGNLSGGGYIFGRWGCCIKLVTANDPVPNNWITAFLMWSVDNNWAEGEVDYPNSNGLDGDLTTAVVAGVYQGGSAFDEVDTGVVLTDGKYHTFYCDWTSGNLTFNADGVNKGTITSGVPTTAFRVSMQNESSLTGAAPTGNIIFEVAWMYIDVY